MTVVVIDGCRTEMPDNGEPSLDELFARLERMPVPEGFKTEIVEGTVYMSPQTNTHWEIIAAIYDQLRTRYPRRQVKSDVRFDFPGHLNGFAPDVVALAEGARSDDEGRCDYRDIECVAEVISKDTAENDYVTKRAVYAAAGVPVYVIADPRSGWNHVFTEPENGVYQSDLTLAFGKPLDLTHTVVGLQLTTEDFPRD